MVILHKGEVRHQGTLDELLAQGNRKEILVAGALDASWSARPGIHAAERVGPTVTRLMVESAASNDTLQALLQGGVEVLQVTDRRISLEELFVQTAGTGPVGAREVEA